MLGNIDSLAELKLLPSIFSRLKPVKLNTTEEALYAELVFLLKTFFFVYIGLSMRFTHWETVAVGFAITAALFLVRIPVVRWSLSSNIPRADAAFACVMVPKGLAAAVLASLPIQAGLASGAIIQETVYAIVLFSIAAATCMTFLLERGRINKLYGALLPGFIESTTPQN
jgi:NhaP-type Na+/H+ or K+/H+ antiporter